MNRKGTKNGDPLICTLKNFIKTQNWKPQYAHKGPIVYKETRKIYK